MKEAVMKVMEGYVTAYKNNDKELLIETKVFASSIDRVATISSDKSKAVKFLLKDELKIPTRFQVSGDKWTSEDKLEGGVGASKRMGAIQSNENLFYISTLNDLTSL